MTASTQPDNGENPKLDQDVQSVLSDDAPESTKYKAFISYSHQDKKWGDWLHKALETYRVPKGLIGKQTDHEKVPARLFPVFRDREELPTATELGDMINEALQQSSHLIVICSPRSAKSEWVNEEILQFKRLGKSNRILCLIVDGEPNAADKPELEQEECFPDAVKYQLDEGGELTTKRTEPIAADARKGKDGKQNSLIKIVAGLLGVGFDDLKRREALRRQKRMVAVATLSMFMMAVMGALTVWALMQRVEAEDAKNAEIEQRQIAVGEKDRADVEKEKALLSAQVAEQQRVVAVREQDRAEAAELLANQNAEETRLSLIRAIAAEKSASANAIEAEKRRLEAENATKLAVLSEAKAKESATATKVALVKVTVSEKMARTSALEAKEATKIAVLAEAKARQNALDAEKRRLEADEARKLAVVSETKAKASAQNAEKQRVVAIRERDRADRNFRDAQGAVELFFTRISEEELLNTDGMQPLRRSLLEEALRYYRQFSADQSSDDGVQLEFAKTQLRVASIVEIIGDKNEAVRETKEAIVTLEHLLKVAPKEVLFEASVILGGRPSEINQGDPAAAVNSNSNTAFLGAGLSTLNDNLTKQNKNVGVRIDALSLGGPAWRAQLQEADVIVEVDGSPAVSTEKVIGKIQGKSPGNTLAVVIRRNPYRNAKVELSNAINALSTLQWGQGDYEQSLGTLLRSVAINRSLINDYPNDTVLLLNYQAGLVNLPLMQRSVGRLADAAATYEELWRLYEQVALQTAEPLGWIRSEDPHPDGIRVIRVQPDSAAAESGLQANDVVLEVNDESVNLGMTRNDFGGMPGDKLALLVKRDAETMTLTITVRPSPTIELAAVARNVGVLYNSYLGDLKLAKTWFIRSLKIARRRRALIFFYLPEEKQDHQYYSNFLAGVLVELGSVSYRIAMAKGGTGDLSEAISALEEAVEIEMGLVEANPSVLDYQQMLGIGSANLANMYSANGSVDKAVSLLNKSVTALEALVRLNPSEPNVRFNLADANVNLGHIVVKLAAQIEHYEKAMVIYDALINEGWEQRRVQSKRGNLHRALARMNWDEGKHQVAIVHYRAAAHDIASLITEPSTVFSSENDRLIEIWENLVLLQGELGEGSAVAKIRTQIASVRLRRIGELQELFTANGLDKEIRIDLARELNALAAGQASTTPADIEQQRVWYHALLKLFGDKPDADSLDDLEADLVSRGYGNLAWCDILAKNPESAIRNCRVALEYSPDANWISQNMALALLYNGQLQKSISIYEILLAGAEDKKGFRQEVKSEFDDLHRRGLGHSDMNKLLKELE